MNMLSTTTRLLLMGSRNLRRNLRRTVITVVGLGLGFALAAASWMLIDGYLQATIDAMVGGTTGHLQVVHPGQLETPNLFDVVSPPEQVVAQLESIPGVTAASPRIDSAVLLAAGDRSAGAQLFGLDPASEGGVSARPDQVVAGRFVAGPGEVVLGVDLARALHLDVGDDVVAVSQAADGSMANALWRVTGLADTRSATTNRVLAWTTLAEAEDFLALDGAHVIVGVVDDANHVGPIVEAVAALPGYTGVYADLDPESPKAGEEPHLQPVQVGVDRVVRSWRAINPFMAQMFELGRSWTLISVTLVLVTAGLGAANTMSMSVAERTRELGILIAVGMRPAQMIALVLFEALAMYAWSLIVGLVVGGALGLWLVERGLDFSNTGEDLVFGGVSMEPVFHGVWSAQAFWVPAVMLLVVSIFASTVPAVRAARLNPVDTMRR